MDNESKAFSEDLDRLIELFKKLKSKASVEKLDGLDKTFYNNIDMLIANYEMVKKDLPREFINQMGAPLQQMISELIKQLKNELGEVALLQDDPVQKAVPLQTNLKNLNIDEELKKIEASLTSYSLSNKEIDDLLDRRATLVVAQKEFSHGTDDKSMK